MLFGKNHETGGVEAPRFDLGGKPIAEAIVCMCPTHLRKNDNAWWQNSPLLLHHATMCASPARLLSLTRRTGLYCHHQTRCIHHALSIAFHSDVVRVQLELLHTCAVRLQDAPARCSPNSMVDICSALKTNPNPGLRNFTTVCFHPNSGPDNNPDSSPAARAGHSRARGLQRAPHTKHTCGRAQINVYTLHALIRAEARCTVWYDRVLRGPRRISNHLRTDVFPKPNGSVPVGTTPLTLTPKLTLAPTQTIGVFNLFVLP